MKQNIYRKERRVRTWRRLGLTYPEIGLLLGRHDQSSKSAQIATLLHTGMPLLSKSYAAAGQRRQAGGAV